MATNPIGFGHTYEKEETEVLAPIENLDASFLALLKDIGIEQETLRKQQAIDKDLRESLVRLHQRMHHIRELVKHHTQLWGRYYAVHQKDPKRARELLEEIGQFEGDFQKPYADLQQEMQKHVLPDLSQQAEILRGKTFSVEGVSHYREVLSNLHYQLNAITLPIMQSYSNRSVENAHRALMDSHPEIRG